MKPNTTKFWDLLLFGALVIAAIAPAFAPSYANEARPESTQVRRPCAVVDKFSGDAQVLNDSRTKVEEADEKTPVECGGWVSVQSGWLTLQHRFGYRIHVGPGTFAQFLDDADAIVVYRGQVFVQAGGGMGELRVVTPNARVRMSRGSMITLFDPEEEKTQLTVVDGKAAFENRFDTAKKSDISVKSGYASTLDFKLLRVVPSVPKLVASSSLKAKLKELHVSERESERALAVTRNRQKELFSEFEKKENENVETKMKQRSIASVKKTEDQHDPEKNERVAKDYLLRKTLGGSEEGMKILEHPSAQRKPAQKASVQVEDPEAQLLMKQKRTEDAEKRRLIEELSKIRSD